LSSPRQFTLIGIVVVIVKEPEFDEKVDVTVMLEAPVGVPVLAGAVGAGVLDFPAPPQLTRAMDVIARSATSR